MECGLIVNVTTQYSSDSQGESPEKKPPEKKRSFLQAPKSYSKLPAPSTTFKQPISSTYSSPSPPPQEVEYQTPKTQPIPIPQSSPGQNSVINKVETQEFFIGDRVTIGGFKPGTLLYFGTTHLASGLWCGIALDEADGKHDGLVNDVRYFTCRNGHGIFAPVERVSHFDSKVTQLASNVISSPVKVSKIPNQSKVCHSHPIQDEIEYQDRSHDVSDKCEQDTDDEILGLDENGIIHDTEEEEKNSKEKYIPKRKLPKLPRTTLHGLSRLQLLKQELSGNKMAETIVDEAVELLQREIMQQRSAANEDDMEELERNHTLSLDEKLENELQLSTGGSSGGEDSWSLSKDYITMSDGKQYLNITFDGESESKTSTQEPSEESPSPEFIFDQEMIEDGEFSSQPMQISRDSSLGLLSNLALDRTDLLYELADGIDGVDYDQQMQASQETLEAVSEEKMSGSTPEKADTLNDSVDFDDGDITSSTPFTDNHADRAHVNANLNETYTQNEDVSSQINDKMCLNCTYTQNVDPNSSLLDTDPQTHLNSTYTMMSKTEVNASKVIGNHVKASLSEKGPMVDSGISMRGSLTESEISLTSMRGSMAESALSMKGSIVDSAIKSRMLDSGITVGTVESSGFSQQKSQMDITKSVEIENKVLDGDTCNTGEIIERDTMKGIDENEEINKDVVCVNMDDKKLMSDLKSGHQRKERPISFLSTTSADTGYAPDTDSEIGTLTLNSPQEWMDRGFHGNTDHTEMPHTQRNLIYDIQERTKLEPIPVESDSDFGTMTGDTDNEADRPEIVHPVEACESQLEGVNMGPCDTADITESEDEITQVETSKMLNTTITLDKQDETFTAEPICNGSQELDSTFTVSPDDENQESKEQGETADSFPIVTIVIADKEEGDDIKKEDTVDGNTEKKNEKPEKLKTPKKKKFNVVKDFKKPNTTNVVSKLSEYLKAPLPVKPKEDKANTEEAKNKRNSLKGKIDLSKVTSKLNIDNKIVEEKNNGTEKKEKEIIEKEPVKKVKRTPPKSKWDTIMSQIDNKKEVKPKTEVKSKLEAFSRIPPPVTVKKEDEKPKPKKKISSAIPDYSKVQSKLKYTAPPPPPKPKLDESPSRSKTDSPSRKKDLLPNHSKTDSPSVSIPDSPRKSKNDTSKSSLANRSKNDSPSRNNKDVSPTRDKLSGARKLSKDLSKIDRMRNLSGDLIKRPEIKDKVLHIDLADSLDGRGSRAGTGSALSSRPSSTTDMSTTGVDEEVEQYTNKHLPQIERTMSLQSDRPSSTSATSEISEAGSQVTARELEIKLQNAQANQQRRKSGLLPPTNSLDSFTNGVGGGGHKLSSGARIVKPVIRQHSAPSPLISTSSHVIKPSMFTNKAPPKKTAAKRSRNQNRNKTSKSKKESKEKIKSPETVLAELHTKEVQRLEALCESRTKQLNMVKLQLQTSNQAFDGMSTTVHYLAHDLDAFSCPKLLKETVSLKEQVVSGESRISVLEEQKTNLEEIIQHMKECHKEYIDNFEVENEQSLKYQREALTEKHEGEIRKLEDKRISQREEVKRNQESFVAGLKLEHVSTVERLQIQHREEIMALQRRQENQMEELHKQHQDKLEDITSRFDSIKVTLSDKVETLRSECDRLRDRARACEDALQRDSDYKVQCALAPYKDLPQEIESLKTVLEMRNEEINKLRTQNIELQKKLEELPVAQDKIITLHQKKENLEAIISMKTDHEKTLHERCQNLMKKYDKESRANKRLSMEYEELMWKLSESFSENDEMGSQEALFYKKLGMSPESHDAMESPTLGRKLRTPTGSESSPSKSPAYRRTLSSNVDDREDRKFKRRSGNFLLDEMRHRPNSPLAKQQNAMMKSWSPSTQSPSPTRSSNSTSNRMSQSWCVDVFDEPEQIVSKIPKSRSNSEKVTMRRKKAEDKVTQIENTESEKVSVSKESLLSSRLQATEVQNVSENETKTNGVETNDTNSEISAKEKTTKTRTRKDTVTLSEDEIILDHENRLVSDSTSQNGHSPDSELQSPTDTKFEKPEHSPTKDSVVLQTGNTISPPSKLPVTKSESDRRLQEIKKPVTRSHRESAV